MASLTKDVGVILAARIVVLFAGLGLEVSLARFLQPAGRGSFEICIMFSTFLQLVFLTGWNTASIYFVASKRLTLSEGVTQTVIYGVVSSALAIVTGLALMRLPLAFFDAADARSFWLALLLIPTTFFAIVFLQLLTAVHEFGWFAVISVGNGVSFLLLAVVFVGLLAWGVYGALLACILRNCLVVLAAWAVLRRKCDVRLAKPSLRSFCKILHYGLRQQVGQIANDVNVQIGTMMLALFATRAEVGLLAVAVQVMAKGVMTIPETMMTVLLPKASEDKTGRPELIARCARLTGLVCAILILIIAASATPIVRLLFSPSFVPVVSLIRILAVGTLVRCTCKVFTPYLQGMNHPGIESFAVAMGAVVNLVALLCLLPVIGLPAAALSITLSYLTSSAIVTLGFVRLSRLDCRQTFWLSRSDLAVAHQAISRLLPFQRRWVVGHGPANPDQ